MNEWLSNPVFRIYAASCLVLCANLLFLWAYSGAKRGATKTTPNAEDVALFGSVRTEIDPEPVARVLRAHRNAEALIYPFLLLGWVFVLAGGTQGIAAVLFGTFTVARLLHSFAYLKGLQPWRTLSFAVSGFATIALLLYVAWLMLRAG